MLFISSGIISGTVFINGTVTALNKANHSLLFAFCISILIDCQAINCLVIKVLILTRSEENGSSTERRGEM